jgi:hypothetical protein
MTRGLPPFITPGDMVAAYEKLAADPDGFSPPGALALAHIDIEAAATVVPPAATSIVDAAARRVAEGIDEKIDGDATVGVAVIVGLAIGAMAARVTEQRTIESTGEAEAA